MATPSGVKRAAPEGAQPVAAERPAGAPEGPDPTRRLVPRVQAGPAYRPPRRVPYWLVTIVMRVMVNCYLRVRVDGRDHLPSGPALLAFTHGSWLDPFVLVAALPARPDLLFYGPREADMRVGTRNRLMTWSGRAIPFKPDGSDARPSAHLLVAALDAGAHVAIAPEGRIHASEREVLPLASGAAWSALHAGVPIVPIGTTGLGWLRFGRTVRVRIGQPIPARGRPTRASVDALTAELRHALLELVADGRNEPPPGPIGRWLTELFNDWPEGARPDIPPD